MQSYLYTGVVLPERAQLDLQFEVEFRHLESDLRARAKVNIVLNQVAAWVEVDGELGVFDLRNAVQALIQNRLSLLGYLKGYAYDLEITRVINKEKKIDHVFGIGVPCLEVRSSEIDLPNEFKKLQSKLLGPEGVLISRCLNDLVSAMKNPQDTAFYCYRAIESLRNHSTLVHKIELESPSQQWENFRTISGVEEARIMQIKTAADPLRHGHSAVVTDQERVKLFENTWDIVRDYFAKI